MDFDLNEEERSLQQGIRELLAGRFPMERVREGFTREAWAEIAGAGVFALWLATDRGGLGLGATHAAVVYEELGRALVPGPLVGQQLGASLVDGAASGERVVGVVEPAARPTLVEHADAIDDLLLVEPGLVARLNPAQLDGADVARPFDPLTPVRSVEALPPGEELGTNYLSKRLIREGTLLTAALQLGNALATTDLAVAYAKEREQFNKPIGAFQAVKHLCADMLVRAEVARAAVYAAAVTLDDPTVGGLDRAIATAKVQADHAAYRNAKACIQVHGGMGFTWEVDAHLYLKRAVLHRTHFGHDIEHAGVLADSLGATA